MYHLDRYNTKSEAAEKDQDKIIRKIAICLDES